MSYSFTQAVNKIQNGKYMTRPSWSNAQFILATPFTPMIMYCVPSNMNTPCTNYVPSIEDISGTDWIEKV